MKISSGVEWSAHACALLGVLPPGKSLSADAIAEFHDVPGAYMAKQMQLLARGGVVKTMRGRNGGYALDRAPTEITMAEIYKAVEGAGPSFLCTEIRQNGPCGAARQDCKKPCGVASVFHDAEREYLRALAQTSVADIMGDAARNLTPERAIKLANWLNDAANG